jgi:hypothetical protein
MVIVRKEVIDEMLCLTIKKRPRGTILLAFTFGLPDSI